MNASPPGSTAPAPGPDGTARVRAAGRLLVLALCALHAFTHRHAINPDGISYLDVAGAYGRGDLDAAVNHYWSPLFSWLLAAAGALVQPGPYWEAALAHAVCFVGFLLSLLAFEWLLAEVLRSHRKRCERGDPLLPAWFVAAVAYAGFLWASRWLVGLAKISPDMIVAAVVYAAAALLLRLRRDPAANAPAWGLGVLLGLGYLAKAILLPVGLVVLVVLPAFLPRPGRWGVVGRAALLFAIVAGGWVAVLSLDAGRLTAGETGRLNYLWYVGCGPHPRDLGRDGETPAVARVRPGGDALLVMVFDRPSAGSFPLWYDPSEFVQGHPIRWDLGRQLEATGAAAIKLARLVARHFLPPTLAVLLVAVLAGWYCPGKWSGWAVRFSAGLAAGLPLLVPAAVALGLYLVVGVVDGRLLGPFLLLGLVAVLLAIPVDAASAAALRRPAGLVAAALALLAFGGLALDVREAVRAVGESATAHPHWHVAQELARAGLRPGDRVATVGDAFWSYWARIGKFRLVAAVPGRGSEPFWRGTSDEQDAVCLALRDLGVRAVVARAPDGVPAGWAAVAGTGFVFRALDR